MKKKFWPHLLALLKIYRKFTVNFTVQKLPVNFTVKLPLKWRFSVLQLWISMWSYCKTTVKNTVEIWIFHISAVIFTENFTGTFFGSKMQCKFMDNINSLFIYFLYLIWHSNCIVLSGHCHSFFKSIYSKFCRLLYLYLFTCRLEVYNPVILLKILI